MFILYYRIRKKGGWDTIEIEGKGIRQLIRGRNREKRREITGLLARALSAFTATPTTLLLPLSL